MCNTNKDHAKLAFEYLRDNGARRVDYSLLSKHAGIAIPRWLVLKYTAQLKKGKRHAS
jgi:hypothetical protein